MWSVLSGIEDSMRFFDAFDRQISEAFVGRRERETGGSISLTESADALVFTAELPGVARADVEITIEADVLTVRASRKQAAPEGYKLVRQERQPVELFRKLALPCRVDADAARADLSGGILTVRLPKASEARPRRISLNTAS